MSPLTKAATCLVHDYEPRAHPATGLFSFTGVTVNEHTTEPRLTRELAAHAAGVQPDTVKKWTTRGWIDKDSGERRYLEVAKRDWRGRPLYRFADVMAAERATRPVNRKTDKRHWAALNANSAGMGAAC